ncbi:hypothetical protein ACFLYI_00565 [Chloroflexota bacterium]
MSHTKGFVKGRYKKHGENEARLVIALTASTVGVLREHREAQEKLREALGLQLSDNDLVFCRYDGTPYRPDSISHAWRKLAKKICVNARLHDARHSHASLMLKWGTS